MSCWHEIVFNSVMEWHGVCYLCDGRVKDSRYTEVPALTKVNAGTAIVQLAA